MRKYKSSDYIYVINSGMRGYIPDSHSATTSRKQAESIAVDEKRDLLYSLNDSEDNDPLRVWRAYGSARNGYISLECDDPYTLNRYVGIDSIRLGEIADASVIDSINSAHDPADALQDWLNVYYG